MKILFFIFFTLIFLGGNYYVFYRMWQSMPPNLIGRIILIAIAAIVILSLILTFTVGDSLPVGLASVLYKIGTSWIFIMLYFVIVLLVKDIIGLANRFLHFMPADALTRYTVDNWVGLGFMVGFISLVMVCGYLKYTWKVRVEQPIAIEKSIGDRETLTIVAISDLHLGYGIGVDEQKQWIELINKENPDVVLIAGDMIDSSTRPLNAREMYKYFEDINAPVYMCLGNHEYISGIDSSLAFIDKTGVTLLRDSSVLVDSTFYVVGRDDKMNPRRKDLAELTAGMDKTKPIILLDHQPYGLEEAEACGIDFQFSGHTHRGQVWPISMITDAIYEDDHGYIKKGDTNVYVSSGIGIWGGKFRIGTQSEYVVVKIKRK